MYGTRGDDSALFAAMGVPPELRDGLRQAAVVEIYPENETAVAVFSAMGTQWRVGMTGPTGLDYSALPAVLDLCNVPADDRGEVFAGIRILESAALEVMAEMRKA